MLKFLTAGESHGPELTVIVEGLPAGIPVTEEEINFQLERRRKGEGSGGRMKIEQDRARISGGIMNGFTTGSPVSIVIRNRDYEAWRDREIPPMTIPRPGHADLAATIKYGYPDLRLALERASARETASRVAMGAICRKFLSFFDIITGSYVVSIGKIKAQIPKFNNIIELFESAENSPVRCPDQRASKEMTQEIKKASESGETLGGVFECVAVNVPPGLGSHVHWDRRLSSRLLGAVGSIPAIKGVETGDAFKNATRKGSQVHDAIWIDSNGFVKRSSNRAGGIEGGISTGQPIVVRAAMKPISTLMRGMQSIDLASGKPAQTVYERSDICAVPRAAVVAEAMVAFVLADALIEKLGGDSLNEMLPRFNNLKLNKITDFSMDNKIWRFGYD